MGWQFRKTDSDYAAFTIRGTSDWDDRRGGVAFNGSNHVWAMRKSPIRKSQWVDGSLEFEVVDTGAIAAAPNDDLVLGARDQDGIGSHASVEIAEILIFDSALSNEVINQIEGYLAHKWGLLDKLPSSHPYKEMVPLFENRPKLILPERFSLLKNQAVSFPILTDRVATQVSVLSLSLIHI